LQAVRSLVDVTRAQQVESWHGGVMVIARASGELVGVVGDPAETVFPRSAVKIIQALPLIETGAADRFRFSDMELALACASHIGAPGHVAAVDALLHRLGLAHGALACGAHPPIGEAARNALIRSGQAPSPLHNNCSGKHAGMLATAVHLNEGVEGYELAGHPVQARIRSVFSDVAGVDLAGVVPGIDGCSVPNWPLPIDRLAVAFARIVSGEGLEGARARAFRRLLDACWAQPEAMAGEGRFETGLLKRFRGEVFVKGGAEGVSCGGIRSQAVGFAIKVNDGTQRAAEKAVGAILARLIEGAEDLGKPSILTNAAGVAVGDVRAGAALIAVLDSISV